jgi:hypothetical protein
MTPDYRFRTIEIARDALECLNCDSGLDIEQRVEIQRAITSLNSVRFALYPLRKPLEVVK